MDNVGLGGVSTYVTSAVSERCDQVLFIKLELDELSCVMLSSSFNHQHSTLFCFAVLCFLACIPS